MKRTFLSFLILMSFLWTLPVSAATFGGGEKGYTLGQGEVVLDDLYIGASTVTISGNVEGDVFAGGGTIIINGTVTQDVMVGGGSITILGPIGDDLRAGGGTIVVSNNVGDDILIGAGTLHILPGVTIGGDILVGGGQITIEGDVQGNINANGGEVILNGPVAGNVEVVVEELTIGKNAAINGNVIYRAPKEATIDQGAIIGGDVIFRRQTIPVTTPTNAILGILSAFFLAKLFIVLTAAIVSVLLFKKLSLELGRHAVSHFGKELVRGLVLLIVLPILGIILLVTILGSFMGILVLLTYATFLVMAKVYAGIIFGGLISKLTSKNVEIDWRWALLGVVLLEFISLIPLIGWIVSLIFILVALGTTMYFWHQHVWLGARR